MTDRKYICDYQGCAKEFSSKGNLKRYLIIHSGEKIYECNFEGCSKAFSQISHLIRHLIIHSGKRPYICGFDGCDKSFSQFLDLKMHLNIHTKEKPYVCYFEGCNKAFSANSNLIYHINIHKGKKPYICCFEGCNKAFTHSSSLKTHNRTHSGEKPYKCVFEGCGIAFSQIGHLKNHKISWHTEEGQQRKKKSEEYTAKLLEKEGIDFKREHQVSFTCNGGTFCRIDYLYINKGVIFAIENDEHQHKEYPLSCEVRRMIEVKSVFVQDGNNLPLVWIRYNPDKFNKGENKGKINKKDRVKEIVKLMGKLSYESNLPPLSIYYCYYDTNEDEELCVLDDPDFPEDLKSLTSCIN